MAGANCVDPGETAECIHSAGFHMGLHCLFGPLCPLIYGNYGKML